VARLFISYRAADGRDKATALARDLGELFGDEQVFLDKDDLRGGVRWREAISAAIAERPVLLLLLTPQLLAATDERHGRLRIGHQRRPGAAGSRERTGGRARRSLPLLCDDLPAPPDCSHLPPPFDRLGEFSWRQLRAYDCKNDLQRLVADLRALGVVPARHSCNLAIAQPTPAPAAGVARRSWLAGAAGCRAVLLALAVGWYALSPAELAADGPDRPLRG
jgi:hypothetical protein